MTKVTVEIYSISEKKPNHMALCIVLGFGELFYNNTKERWDSPGGLGQFRQVRDTDQWFPLITTHDVERGQCQYREKCISPTCLTCAVATKEKDDDKSNG